MVENEKWKIINLIKNKNYQIPGQDNSPASLYYKTYVDLIENGEVKTIDGRKVIENGEVVLDDDRPVHITYVVEEFDGEDPHTAGAPTTYSLLSDWQKSSLLVRLRRKRYIYRTR